MLGRRGDVGDTGLLKDGKGSGASFCIAAGDIGVVMTLLRVSGRVFQTPEGGELTCWRLLDWVV